MILLKRNFRFTEAELIQEADAIHMFSTRDIALFAEFGVTVAMLDQFMIDRNNFSDFATDGEMMGDMVYARQQRDALMELVKQKTDAIIAIARFTLGKEDGRLIKYQLKSGISQLNADDLLRAGRKVLRAAGEAYPRWPIPGQTG